MLSKKVEGKVHDTHATKQWDLQHMQHQCWDIDQVQNVDQSVLGGQAWTCYQRHWQTRTNCIFVLVDGIQYYQNTKYTHLFASQFISPNVCLVSLIKIRIIIIVGACIWVLKLIANESLSSLNLVILPTCSLEVL